MLELVGCAGYVRGFSDSLNILHRGFPNFVRICMPWQATAGQLIDVVSAYVIAHPADRHRDIDVLIIGALGDAYPCQDKADKPTASFERQP
jgi:hypothetical protein